MRSQSNERPPRRSRIIILPWVQRIFIVGVPCFNDAYKSHEQVDNEVVYQPIEDFIEVSPGRKHNSRNALPGESKAKRFGMRYHMIDVFQNDCPLFWKEH